jgi:parvulin-like peptidyl-prolyl isomerase
VVPINYKPKGIQPLAKKNKKTEVKRLPTKRQLSRKQQHEKMQRIIIISGSIFFALIVALVGYGIYTFSFKDLREDVLKVNDTVFKMDYYVDALEIFIQGADADQMAIVTDFTLGTILQNELIIQNAPELGINIDSDEIDDRIKELGQPNNKVYRDIHKADLLLKQLFEEYLNPKIPTEAEQVKVEALVVETIERAEEITQEIGASGNFTSIAELFSVEPVTKENKGDLGWLAKGLIDVKYASLADSKLEEIVFDIEPGILSTPIYDPSISKESGYWILEVLEKDGDKSVNARGILLGSREEAAEIKAKLESGDDFASLVLEKSQHQESRDYGGDLGWLQKGFGDEIVNNAAFESEVDEISDPIYDDTVSTNGGYWLVKVLDKEVQRQIEEELTNKMRADAFTEWIAGQRDKSVIEDYLDEEQKAWALEKAIKNLGA